MRGRLLVADDDPLSRGSLVAELAAAGYDVLEAGDGAGALTHMRGERLDAVLLDVSLPDLDGAATLAELDASLLAALPVVVMGTRDETDAVRRAIDAGAFDMLQKPGAAGEVLARIGAAVRCARATQDLGACRAELAEAGRTDHLTGLASRRHMDDHLAMATSASRRHRQHVALLLVDVDHFRRVNDSEGHAAGDDVLRAVASRIAHVLRGEDMAGRWGGEEFLVVAPTTDLDGAWRLGERIRQAVTRTPIPLASGRDVLVTVSVGCATGEGDDIDGQLRRAEAALEHAKSHGRNRVCTDAEVPA